MNRCRTIAITLGFVVVVSIFLFFSRNREPVFQGRTLSHWTSQYYEKVCCDGSSPGLAEAEKAIQAIGTNAIPFLLHDAAIKDSRLKLRVMEFLQMEAPSARMQALGGLAVLGTNAASALPTLAKMMNDPESARLIPGIFERIGGASIPYLIPKLSSPDIDVRCGTLQAFQYFGTNATPALPQILQLANDSNLRVRSQAVEVLRSLAPHEPKKVVPVLNSCLTDPSVLRDSTLTDHILKSLAKYGPEAKESVPAIVPLFYEKPHTRYASLALTALMGTNALPYLMGGLTNADSTVQLMSLGAFVVFTNSESPPVDLVLPFVDSTNKFCRQFAISVLGKWHREPQRVVPVLIRALEDPDDNLKQEAVEALVRFGKEAKPALPMLMELAKNENRMEAVVQPRHYSISDTNLTDEYIYENHYARIPSLAVRILNLELTKHGEAP